MSEWLEMHGDLTFKCPYLTCVWPACRDDSVEHMRHPSCVSARWTVANAVRSRLLRIIKPEPPR